MDFLIRPRKVDGLGNPSYEYDQLALARRLIGESTMRTRPILLSAIALALAISLSAMCAEPPQPAAALQKSFVWTPSAPTGKQVYAVFRKTLELKGQPQSAVLRLFADSRYILWINGKYVDRGPCRFDPKGPEYDTLDVKRFLQPGANTIADSGASFSRWPDQRCGFRGSVRAPCAGTYGIARTDRLQRRYTDNCNRRHVARRARGIASIRRP